MGRMMTPEEKAARAAEREAKYQRETDEHIARIVAAAPRATEAKRQRIAALLAAGRTAQRAHRRS